MSRSANYGEPEESIRREADLKPPSSTEVHLPAGDMTPTPRKTWSPGPFDGTARAANGVPAMTSAPAGPSSGCANCPIRETVYRGIAHAGNTRAHEEHVAGASDVFHKRVGIAWHCSRSARSAAPRGPMDRNPTHIVATYLAGATQRPLTDIDQPGHRARPGPAG